MPIKITLVVTVEDDVTANRLIQEAKSVGTIKSVEMHQYSTRKSIELTVANIENIMTSYKSSEELANLYGISASTIYRIRRGEHLLAKQIGRLKENRAKSTRIVTSRAGRPPVLKEREVRQIQKSTDTISTLASRYGVSTSTIARVRSGNYALMQSA